MKGGPTKDISQRELSVQILIALRDLTAPLISTPSEIIFSPDVELTDGVKLLILFWSDHLTSKGLKMLELNSLEPKLIKCLSLGDTKIKLFSLGEAVTKAALAGSLVISWSQR